MKSRDKYLFKVTKPVWDELCSVDCNPDIIPFALADACEIGFNKGFTAALIVAGVTSVGAFIGGTVAKHFIDKKKK